MINIINSNSKTVFVAMSGGVDSSVVACLMKERGYNVVGVTMCFSIAHPHDTRPSCCGVAGIEDAKRAAQILDIPHYVFDFARDIRENIIDNFTSEYLNGRTPNPCVQCNQHLKFGSLYAKVMKLGADYLATGHYAKVDYNEGGGRYELKKGLDEHKDQSYFLYSMRKETLPKVLFPLGGLTKTEVRNLARNYGLANAEKPESQDICFVPSTGYRKFLEDHLGKEAFYGEPRPSTSLRPSRTIVPGSFRDESGKAVGEHRGIAFYTIGQRDGLGIALGRPVYVYKIEKETNTVYVGDVSCLMSSGLTASQMNYVSIDPPLKDVQVKVRIRYNAPEVDASVTSLDFDQAEIRFAEPQKSVTPGQSVVVYRDDVVLAGGIIERSIQTTSVSEAKSISYP
jgi:tRNA-specific 2-thiouridylase